MTYNPLWEQIQNERMRKAQIGKYKPEDYHREKLLGKRLPTGALKLKRLSAPQRQIICYHARGLSHRDISLITGYSEISISRIVRDPLSQTYLNELISGAEEELKALMPMAVDAVRGGLESENQKTALSAADKFFRVTGRYQHETETRETAEDVIARALAVMETQAGAIGELARPTRPKALDVQFEEIEDGDDNEDISKALPRGPSVDMG